MPKTFYTESDIQDLADRGVTQLAVNDEVVLTDLAVEMSLKRGIRLVRQAAAQTEDNGNAELIRRVRAAVIARLGDQVDAKMLDAVVSKVVAGMK